MDDLHIARYEQLLGRKLPSEDRERLQRIKNTLNIRDNDAFWDIIIAMEYQRIYYEVLPQRIEQGTADILDKLSVAAKQEVAVAQATLAESVVAQAQKLSLRENMQSYITWGSIVLTLIITYGSLMLWAGYSLGAGNIQNLHMILRMPVGVLLGGVGICSGMCAAVYGARAFAESKSVWVKYSIIATACVFFGILSLLLVIR